jgi:hypothetical protein
MTVHTEDYPMLRSFMGFMASSWCRHVDFDVTSIEDPEVAQMASEASHIIP